MLTFVACETDDTQAPPQQEQPDESTNPDEPEEPDTPEEPKDPEKPDEPVLTANYVMYGDEVLAEAIERNAGVTTVGGMADAESGLITLNANLYTTKGGVAIYYVGGYTLVE